MSERASMKEGPSDYEAMFKQHVHSNLMLHNRIRDMDSLKHKKMQELERNKARFKMQYSKYSTGNFSSVASPRCRNGVKSATPKPVFIVCKHFPCSYRTWTAITDVSDSSIDLYKTDVLQTDEAPLSYRATEEAPNGDNQNDLAPKLRRRSYTMPDIQTFREKPRSRGVSMLKNFKPENIMESTHGLDNSEGECDKLILPDIKVVKCPPTNRPNNSLQSNTFRQRANSDISGIVVVKPCDKSSCLCPDNTVRVQRKNSEVSLLNAGDKRRNLSAGTQRQNSQESPKERPNTTSEGQPTSFGEHAPWSSMRRRSSAAETIQHLLPTERRRCNTVGNDRRPTLQGMTQRRNSRSYTIGIEGYSGYRKASLFEKLLSASCSALDTMNTNAGSEENLHNCRYIRVAGENIEGSHENISLENIDFRHNVSPIPVESASVSDS